MFKFKPVRIGDVRIEAPLALAPLAAVNNVALRLLCKEYGAGLIYTQMYDAEGVLRGTFDKEDIYDLERPLAVQIIGPKPEDMRDAAQIVAPKADIIDINMGCVGGDELGRKAGAYLIKHPDIAVKIASAVVGATERPVSAKIRIGWDSQSINAVEVAKRLEDCGVAAIAVHGRTRKQNYTGKADWDVIRQVKEAVNIPVIGNGDIFKPGHALAMFNQTGCDLAMIGRGAMGDPMLFGRTMEFFNTGTYHETTAKERIECFGKFVEYYHRYSSRQRFPEIKQHAMWFTKYIQCSTQIRKRLLASQNEDDILGIFDSIKAD